MYDKKAAVQMLQRGMRATLNRRRAADKAAVKPVRPAFVPKRPAAKPINNVEPQTSVRLQQLASLGSE